MTEPRGDSVASIAAELGRLGRRLDELGARLVALQVDRPEAPGGSFPAAPYPGGWYPAVPPAPGAGTYAGPAGYPVPAQYPGQFPPPVQSGGHRPPPAWPGRAAPPPHPGRRPSVRVWLASLSGARLLAWTGAGVTLLGVVLLLVLAAARGWFAPPVRIGAGAVLGLALVGLGMRLHRRATSRTGALAVTGTGIATLYLVVAAATALYDYLPVPAGLLLALLVAAGGLGLADRWRAMLLGAGALVGAALLAPVVTGRPTPLLVALVLVLQVVATVVALRRSWPLLVGIAAGWPVLYGTVVAGLGVAADQWGAAAVSAVVLLFGVAGAMWTGRRRAASAEPADRGASESGTAPAPDRTTLPRGLRIGLVVAAPLPALAFAATRGGWTGAALAYLAAVLLFAAAAASLRGAAALSVADHAVGVAALAAGAVALFEATSVALDGNAETAVVLGQGVVLLAVAAVLRSRAALVVAGFFAVAGVLSAVAVQVPPSALSSYPAAPFVLGVTPQQEALVAAVTMSALVLAAAVAALVAAARVGLLSRDAGAARLWVPVGLVGLYGAAGIVVALALLVSPTRSGFVAGHAVVTVSWTVVALVLLARGVRRPALRVSGLVLVAAAVAKLVLFDLVALDGLARVGAFLGAGLLLLAAGTRYARLVAESEPAEPAAGTADPVVEPQPRV